MTKPAPCWPDWPADTARLSRGPVKVIHVVVSPFTSGTLQSPCDHLYGTYIPMSHFSGVEAIRLLDRLDEALLRLHRVFQRPGYRKQLLQYLSMDIELATLRLLRAVQRSDDPPSVGSVAAAITVDPSTASRLVDGAVKAGFVDRRSCINDRRRARLHLTVQGEAILDEVTGRRRELLAQVTAGWDPDKLQEIIALLLTLQAGFDELERSL